MRILFVAFPISIHAARWINQISDQGWELHFIPSVQQPMNSLLQGKVIVHDAANPLKAQAGRFLMRTLGKWPHPRGSGHVRRLIARIKQQIATDDIEQVINQVKPDIVHSMEMQQAGYQTLAAKERMGGSFPTWIMSNWGSDIYLYHRVAAHQATIKRVLELCDYYACECQRDVELAQKLGLKGKVLPVLPCAGGFDLAQWHQLRQPGLTSERKVILLKGYQHWAGRALVGLRAIEMCADLIRERGYRVIIQLATPDIHIAAELVAYDTGIPIEVVAHDEYVNAMRRFGIARIHIGLSISDGISQSLLESMVMGTFPIQSFTACADEWVEDGKNGLLVPPEDPQLVAAALRRAILDDELVDQAVMLNDEIARQRLAYSHIKSQVLDIYKSVFAQSSGR